MTTDYGVLLAEAEVAIRRGVAAEPAADTRRRAQLAIEDVGTQANLIQREAGVVQWASDFFTDIERALRRELCDPAAGKLKKQYNDSLEMVLKPDGIARLAAVILSIVQTINPALAVSSIGVYVATWLLKVGLNEWCASPSQEENP